MKPAGFWIRFAAFIIDSFILSIVILPIYYAYMPILRPFMEAYSAAVSASDITAAKNATMALYGQLFKGPVPIAMTLHVVYFSVLEASRFQATLGKRMVDIKVTDKNGNRISLLQSFARNLAKLLSSLPLYIGYLIAGVSRHKQALHDLMTGSFIVIGKAPATDHVKDTPSKSNSDSTFVS